MQFRVNLYWPNGIFLPC